MIDHLGSGEHQPDWKALLASSGAKTRIRLNIEPPKGRLLEESVAAKAETPELEIPFKQYRWDGKKL